MLSLESSLVSYRAAGSTQGCDEFEIATVEYVSSAMDSLTLGLMQRCRAMISRVNRYQALPLFYFHRSELGSLGTRLCPASVQ